MEVQKVIKKYKVLQTVSYPHPTLGTFVIEAGDTLEQCIDDPNCYSNGLALVTEGNILSAKKGFFKLIKPYLRKKPILQIMNISALSEEKLAEFKKQWLEWSRKPHTYQVINEQPVYISITNRISRKKKKKLKKNGLFRIKL